MNPLIAISSLCVAVTFAPPILPFTEIGDQKIENLGKHMVAADEISTEDFKVFLQLDHIRWKYNRLREEFYNAAKNADGETIIYVKDLGKIFDKMDVALDAEREAMLQEKTKKQEEQNAEVEPNGVGTPT
jgi:environmental stress-induced protein Ves